MSGVDDRANERASYGPVRRDDDRSEIKVHTGSSGRVIFAESENSDGWIATDTTVAVER